MKFNKLHNLIEGIFEPATDPFQRKYDAFKRSDITLADIVWGIVEENEIITVNDVEIDEEARTIKVSFWYPKDQDQSDMNRFASFVDDKLIDFDIYVNDETKIVNNELIISYDTE